MDGRTEYPFSTITTLPKTIIISFRKDKLIEMLINCLNLFQPKQMTCLLHQDCYYFIIFIFLFKISHTANPT